MKTRREFLTMVAGLGIVLKFSVPVFAASANKTSAKQQPTVVDGTAITQVYGDGVRLTGVAVQYNQPVNGNLGHRQKIKPSGPVLFWHRSMLKSSLMIIRRRQICWIPPSI